MNAMHIVVYVTTEEPQSLGNTQLYKDATNQPTQTLSQRDPLSLWLPLRKQISLWPGERYEV